MEIINNSLPLGIKQSAETLSIYLYDDIKGDGYDWWSGEKIESETSCKHIQKLLDDNPKINKIELHINSNGGDVKEGIGIYSLLARHPAQKTAYIDGFAASVASVIPMACDRIVMSAVSLMFLHHAGMCVFGNAEQLRKAADDVDVIDGQSCRAYKEHAGDKLSDEKLKELLDNETWLSADECLELGLCDEVETKKKEDDPKTVAQSLHDKFKMAKMQEIENKNKTIIQQLADNFRTKNKKE